ncbi:MAG: hypothetical protein V3T83_15445 [Acidobacteriota bacterium]
MRLHLADVLLERARLWQSAGNAQQSRQSLGKGKNLIAKIGYHRRDDEVAVLEELLVQEGNWTE